MCFDRHVLFRNMDTTALYPWPIFIYLSTAIILMIPTL